MEKFGTLEFVLDRYSGTWCWKISGNRAVNMASKLIPRGWYGDKPDEVIVSDTDENIKKLKMINDRYYFEILSSSVWKRKIAPLTMKKTRVPKIEKLRQATPSKQFKGNLLDFQREGLDFLIKSSGNALLADEMGLGKTVQTLAYLSKEKNSFPALIVAPTASISIICGGASPGVEPIAANSYTHKTLSGSYNVRNRYLEKILKKYDKNNEEIWSSITTNQGSVSHLDFLTDLEKDVFKTAFEIDQKWIVELGADRTPYISQAQSINIFLPADVHKKELHQIHFQAWKKGLKSLYYCRSKSIQRAENINGGSSADIAKNFYSQNKLDEEIDEEECLSCQ